MKGLRQLILWIVGTFGVLFNWGISLYIFTNIEDTESLGWFVSLIIVALPAIYVALKVGNKLEGTE